MCAILTKITTQTRSLPCQLDLIHSNTVYRKCIHLSIIEITTEIWIFTLNLPQTVNNFYF